MTTINLEDDIKSLQELTNQTLVGRIISDRILNKQGVTNIVRNSWRTRQDFTISQWEGNFYAFKFNDSANRDMVLKVKVHGVL